MSGWYPHCCITHRHQEQCRGLQRKIRVISLQEMHPASRCWTINEHFSFHNFWLISTSLSSIWYIYLYLLSFSSSVCSSTEALRAFLSKSPISCPAEGHTDTRISPQAACREISMRRYCHVVPCSLHCFPANTDFSEPASYLKRRRKHFWDLISCGALPLCQLF